MLISLYGKYFIKNLVKVQEIKKVIDLGKIYLLVDFLSSVSTKKMLRNPQSYEMKLPSKAFLDGRSSPWRKLRQVGCYDVAKFRLVTIDSCALIHNCLLFTNLNFDTS